MERNLLCGSLSYVCNGALQVVSERVSFTCSSTSFLTRKIYDSLHNFFLGKENFNLDSWAQDVIKSSRWVSPFQAWKIFI